MEFAVNRRFNGGWMLLTSFGYTWLDQLHATTTNTGALDALAQAQTYNWRPNQRLFGDEGKETSTLWNYKVIGRYTFPWEIGFSGSWKVQSGRQYGRNTIVTLPSDSHAEHPHGTGDSEPCADRFDSRLPPRQELQLRSLWPSQRDGGHLQRPEQRHRRELRDHHRRELSTRLGILDPRIVRFGVRYEF